MRIELDDIQSVAWRACRELAAVKGDQAAELAEQAKALMARAERMQQGATEHINGCMTAVARCHGLEGIPDGAEIDDAGPRVTVTWDVTPVSEDAEDTESVTEELAAAQA